jgi:hypothetical protein
MAEILASLGSFLLEKIEEANPTKPRRPSHQPALTTVCRCAPNREKDCDKQQHDLQHFNLATADPHRHYVS